MQTKKWLAILLAASLLLLLAACNNKEENMNPQATITLEDGRTIVADLYPDMAPNTVNNFISLAEKGYFNNKLFHRVIAGFMIQGGAFVDASTQDDPGYHIAGEMSGNGFTKNTLSHDRGVLSMARVGGDYDSAGGQFFIMHQTQPSPYLDGEYAAFGKVISGMEVVDEIATVQTTTIDGMGDYPIAPIRIKSITVDTFGVDYDEPVTLS